MLFRSFRAEFERRQIDVLIDAPASLDSLPMDRAQMEQVFINVLKNAAEAIGRNGRITIRTGQQSGAPYLIIEDTGAGLSSTVRANLFTPFFSTKEQGQGIGLTLVQEILDQHGFRFSLESAPETPTQFTIWFSSLRHA